MFGGCAKRNKILEHGYYLGQGFFFDSIEDEIRNRYKGEKLQQLHDELEEGLKAHEKMIKNTGIKVSEIEKKKIISDVNNRFKNIEYPERIEKINTIIKLLEKENFSEKHWKYLEDFTNEMQRYYSWVLS